MSLYYKNNAPSSSSQQPHRALEPAPHRAHEPAPHRALEPIDLANALSYADNHPNWTDVWDPRMSTSFTTTKGLLNGPGENNCFLNSAVQVRKFGPLLWSVWAFIMVCLVLYGVIQVLRNAVGRRRGGVLTFLKKRFPRSMLFALRGGGWMSNLQEKSVM